MTRAGAVLAVLALAGTAHADPRPTEAADPAVEDASDANLESTDNRQGLTFTAAVGGGLIVGFGIEDSVGRGGSLALRLGHVATRHTVLTFEISATAALHRPSMSSAVQTNNNTNLLAGAQYYANQSLWLRLAGGVGVYQGRMVSTPRGLGDVQLIGPAVLAGIGVELLRFKWAVLEIEAGTSAMINRDGVLVASGAGLGVAFD